MDKLRVLTGNANPELARKICDFLGVGLGKAKVTHFSDGEVQVEIDESVRGMDVFVVQPTCTPVNENLWSFSLCSMPSKGPHRDGSP